MVPDRSFWRDQQHIPGPSCFGFTTPSTARTDRPSANTSSRHDIHLSSTMLYVVLCGGARAYFFACWCCVSPQHWRHHLVNPSSVFEVKSPPLSPHGRCNSDRLPKQSRRIRRSRRRSRSRSSGEWPRNPPLANEPHVYDVITNIWPAPVYTMTAQLAHIALLKALCVSIDLAAWANSLTKGRV